MIDFILLAQGLPNDWKDLGAFGALIAVVWFVLNWFKTDSKEDRESNHKTVDKICNTFTGVSQKHIEDHAADREKMVQHHNDHIEATNKIISGYSEIIKADKEFQIKREEQFVEQSRIMAMQKDAIVKIFNEYKKQGKRLEEVSQSANCNYPIEDSRESN